MPFNHDSIFHSDKPEQPDAYDNDVLVTYASHITLLVDTHQIYKAGELSGMSKGAYAKDLRRKALEYHPSRGKGHPVEIWLALNELKRLWEFVGVMKYGCFFPKPNVACRADIWAHYEMTKGWAGAPAPEPAPEPAPAPAPASAPAPAPAPAPPAPAPAPAPHHEPPPAKPPPAKRQKREVSRASCQHCGKLFRSDNIRRHERRCTGRRTKEAIQAELHVARNAVLAAQDKVHRLEDELAQA